MFGLEMNQVAKIKVVGVGGGGNNAVNSMINSGIKGVDFVVLNTDKQDLDASPAGTKIQLGSTVTGAGGNPESGKAAALECKEEIQKTLEGSDMVFVTCGMGGGTGTGGAPVVAEIAQELGALTVGIVTKPFWWEGPRRKKQADEGIEQLRKHVDSLIVVPNDRLSSITDTDTHLTDSFREVDNVLIRGVQSISDLIAVPGLINLDFADVNSVMEKRGNALIGIGIGVGENRAVEAAEQAVSSPLLETDISGATDAIINVTGGSNLTLKDVETAIQTIRSSANTDINTIFGAVINENLSDEIIVTVIATGFEDNSEPLYHNYSEEPKRKTQDFDADDSDESDDESIIPTFLRKRGF